MPFFTLLGVTAAYKQAIISYVIVIELQHIFMLYHNQALQVGATCLTSTTYKLNQFALQNSFNKNGSNRGKIEIFSEILLFCKQEKTKTSILYKVNLNTAQLRGYLDALTIRGLLVKEENKYKITEKGSQFLKLFTEINDLFSQTSFNRMLSISDVSSTVLKFSSRP